jgi:two-component system NtrC family response regulator
MADHPLEIKLCAGNAAKLRSAGILQKEAISGETRDSAAGALMKYAGSRVLLVDDDKNFRKVTAYALEETGYAVSTAENGRDALETLASDLPEVILCDLNMPVMDGMEFLNQLESRNIEIPVVVITAYGSIESAVEAMRAGAFDFVTKPINRQAVRLAIEKALDYQELRTENRRLREQIAGGRAADRLIGASSAMDRLRETLVRLAESDAPVLITGESGVGKELAARALHYDGPRAATGKFVVLNCAAVPGELLESMLFGHLKGSFTGAHEDRIGKFEAADGGTLFLDEIGDMPLPLQAKLLRALQDGEIERIGDTRPRKVDVRVVSATNQPLNEKIEGGEFRKDLYYRIAVVPVDIPPLRERLDDLPALLQHFLVRHGAAGVEAPDNVLVELRRRAWPGNVRELENLVMRVCALDPSLTTLGPHHLEGAESIQAATKSSFDPANFELPEAGIRFEEVERGLLLAAWEKSGHNQTRGAELLGLPRQAFSYRLQKHGIIPKHGRAQKR